jgi:hypothetical protein
MNIHSQPAYSPSISQKTAAKPHFSAALPNLTEERQAWNLANTKSLPELKRTLRQYEQAVQGPTVTAEILNQYAIYARAVDIASGNS